MACGASTGTVPLVEPLADEVDRLARAVRFSGVVRVDRNGAVEVAAAYGWADRAHDIAATVDTRFGIASGTKGLTALAVMALIEDGVLDLSTPARSVLGADLPLIDDAVTIEHLLAHRSGIGDYVDEDLDLDVGEYLLPIGGHPLDSTERYLPVLGGLPAKFPPGERFSYCNGGYVVLALIAERAGRMPFHELVRRRVCDPAGMADTAFVRSDELTGRDAVGYLLVDGRWRTNVFHLPARGSGDGGIFSTGADIHSFWVALFGGRIVAPWRVVEMVAPRSEVPSESMSYGLGFWLRPSREVVLLEGYDAGVSFRSVHDPGTGTTHTVIGNTSDGAWPITRLLDERLG